MPPHSPVQRLPNKVEQWVKPRLALTSEYQYQPLDLESRDIRLLKLYPGSRDSALVGEILTVSLNKNLVYDALSYVWSHDEPQYELLLGRKYHVSIRLNLRSALFDLRDTRKSLLIWTDAICIDQGNKSEVGHQVQMMRGIYSQATTVRAWIDHEVDLQADIFKYLPRAGELPSQQELLSYDLSAWSPVLSLFKDKYWKRLWIQQELILASEVAIHCRNQNLGEDLTERLLSFPRTTVFWVQQASFTGWESTELVRSLDREINGSFQPFSGGFDYARLQHRNRDTDCTPSIHSKELSWTCLLSLFTSSSQLEASEERDRVYGLLGLALDYEEGDIVIDYDLSVVEVYAQVPSMFLKKYDSLAFLCYHKRAIGFEERNPTWLPTPDKSPRIWWVPIKKSVHFMRFGASGAYIHFQGRILSVLGSRVDSVLWTSGENRLGVVPISKWKQQLESHFHLMSSSTEISSIVDCNDLLNVLWGWGVEEDMVATKIRNKVLSQTEKREAVRKLFSIVDKHLPNLTLDEILLRVDLVNLASPQEIQVFIDIALSLVNDLFIITPKDRIGVINSNLSVRPGDEIWALYGCPLPILLRPRPNEAPGYIWVGCVHNMPGLMKGEGLSGFPEVAEVGFTYQGQETRQIDIW
jgi:hypothetical protein